jgi:hypothetical protein
MVTGRPGRPTCNNSVKQWSRLCCMCCRVTHKSTAYDTDAGTSDQGKARAAAAAGDTQQQYDSRATTGRSTDTAFYTRSSTFESAAAAGAAAAALMDSNPSVVVSPTSSYAGASPDATAAAAAVAAAAAAATAKAAAHQQQHDQDRAPWDDSFHLPNREPPVKRPPVNVEPWRPPKPSEPWKPTAPWRPPSSKYDIPQLAPAEQFPRSVPLDEQGSPMRMQPIRCAGCDFVQECDYVVRAFVLPSCSVPLDEQGNPMCMQPIRCGKNMHGCLFQTIVWFMLCLL